MSGALMEWRAGRFIPSSLDRTMVATPPLRHIFRPNYHASHYGRKFFGGFALNAKATCRPGPASEMESPPTMVLPLARARVTKTKVWPF